MRVSEALALVEELRARVERSERFVCYRWMTVGASGLLAFAASIVQASILPVPTENVSGFLQLWIGVAAVSASVVLLEMAAERYRDPSAFRRQQTWVAIGQFLPCLVAGALMTSVISSSLREQAFLLPGLWSLFFSLGIFGSWRQLPGEAIYAAVYYLAAGTVALVLFREAWALSPWAMASTFGVGQLVSAWVLRDRNKEPSIS